MNLDLPDVTTVGPEYVTKNTEAFEQIDSHNHTSGNGVQIPISGILIDEDLNLGAKNLTNTRSTRLEDQSAVLSDTADKTCVYFVNGNLHINNENGTSVQITEGTGINLSSVGTIGGDYGQPGILASATYSDTTKTYSWTQSSGVTAKMAVGDILLFENIASANPVTIKSPTSLGSPVIVTMPDSSGTLGNVDTIETVSGDWTFTGTTVISGPTTVSGDMVFTGNTSGAGIVPLGAIIAIGDSLTGTFTVPASGVVSEGWQLCDGAAVAGSQTVSGTTYDLTDERFLVGSTTSGTTGGLNETDLSHDHDISHVHQWQSIAAPFGPPEWHSPNARDKSLTTWTSEGSPPTNISKWGDSSGASSGSIDIVSTEDATTNWYTGGVLDPANGTDGSGALSGTSGDATYDNRPQFVSCKYLVRVS
jgi:hypothetical protein